MDGESACDIRALTGLLNFSLCTGKAAALMGTERRPMMLSESGLSGLVPDRPYENMALELSRYFSCKISSIRISLYSHVLIFAPIFGLLGGAIAGPELCALADTILRG